jgi:hypothetical protein
MLIALCRSSVLSALVAIAVACGPILHSYSPVCATPEAAAIYAVLHYQEAGRRPFVLVNVPPGVGISESAIRSDLGFLMDSLDLRRSDSLFGGEGRYAALRSEYYLALDVRPEASSPDSTTLLVTRERCAGWPCSDGSRVVVQREPVGFIARRVEGIFVE